MARLTGACACGTVRFEISGPFLSAGYCHCHRCQRRTGTAASASAQVAATDFAIVAGEASIRTWRPEGGAPKSFCVACGGHVFSGERGGEDTIGVRLGALDADPGIRPSWRQWTSSAATWEPIPQDGLPRHHGARPT